MLFDMRIYPRFQDYLVTVTNDGPTKRRWSKTYMTQTACVEELVTLNLVIMDDIAAFLSTDLAHPGGVIILATEANPDELKRVGYQERFLN